MKRLAREERTRGSRTTLNELVADPATSCGTEPRATRLLPPTQRYPLSLPQWSPFQETILADLAKRWVHSLLSFSPEKSAIPELVFQQNNSAHFRVAKLHDCCSFGEQFNWTLLINPYTTTSTSCRDILMNVAGR